MKSNNNFQYFFPFIFSLNNLFVNSQMSEGIPDFWLETWIQPTSPFYQKPDFQTGDMDPAHISYLPGPNGNITSCDS